MTRRGASRALLTALAVTLGAGACGWSEPVTAPATPEGVAALLDGAEGPEAVARALDVIRRNPRRWSPAELERLRAGLVRRASSPPRDDPVSALYVLFEATDGEGRPFAGLPDLLRVHNRSPDPGVRAAVVREIPERWQGASARLFLATVASTATGRDAPSAEAAVLGLGRIGGEACAELEGLIARQGIPDVGAAALARAMVDEELPFAPSLPGACRRSGWGRILGG